MTAPYPRDFTAAERAAAETLLFHEGSEWAEETERHIELARVVVGAVEPILAADYDRKRQESVIAATHAAVNARGEVARLKHRLNTIERTCAPHLNPKTDPCKARGAAWPCDIAAAIEPDTSLLEFLAKEDEL